MSEFKPTPEEVISMYLKLIRGEISPEEASIWAADLYHPDNRKVLENLEKDDSAFIKLIDGLGFAGEGDMFTVDSYKEWLIDYIKTL